MIRRDTPTLDAGLLLRGYSQGWFPMLHEDGEHHWHDPDPRAVFPLDAVKMRRPEHRLLRSGRFVFTVDQAFGAVMHACAEPALAGREHTWISGEMINAYTALHEQGHARSVEAWENDALVGGIYGVQIGTAFFGESMFSRVSGAGKLAFHHLVDHLRAHGFTLFDTQYINPHTAMLGAVEIPRSVFKRQLMAALSLRPRP